MGIFGWSYPPGAANDPNAPYNQTDDGPCNVCGQRLDECICPECPLCGDVGDPSCYIDYDEDITWTRTDMPKPPHGLVRSFAQVALLAEAERQWAGDIDAENAHWDARALEWDEEIDK